MSKKKGKVSLKEFLDSGSGAGQVALPQAPLTQEERDARNQERDQRGYKSRNFGDDESQGGRRRFNNRDRNNNNNNNYDNNSSNNADGEDQANSERETSSNWRSSRAGAFGDDRRRNNNNNNDNRDKDDKGDRDLDSDWRSQKKDLENDDNNRNRNRFADTGRADGASNWRNDKPAPVDNNNTRSNNNDDSNDKDNDSNKDRNDRFRRDDRGSDRNDRFRRDDRDRDSGRNDRFRRDDRDSDRNDRFRRDDRDRDGDRTDRFRRDDRDGDRNDRFRRDDRDKGRAFGSGFRSRDNDRDNDRNDRFRRDDRGDKFRSDNRSDTDRWRRDDSAPTTSNTNPIAGDIDPEWRARSIEKDRARVGYKGPNFRSRKSSENPDSESNENTKQGGDDDENKGSNNNNDKANNSNNETTTEKTSSTNSTETPNVEKSTENKDPNTNTNTSKDTNVAKPIKSRKLEPGMKLDPFGNARPIETKQDKPSSDAADSASKPAAAATTTTTTAAAATTTATSTSERKYAPPSSKARLSAHVKRQDEEPTVSSTPVESKKPTNTKPSPSPVLNLNSNTALTPNPTPASTPAPLPANAVKVDGSKKGPLEHPLHKAVKEKKSFTWQQLSEKFSELELEKVELRNRFSASLGKSLIEKKVKFQQVVELLKKSSQLSAVITSTLESIKADKGQDFLVKFVKDSQVDINALITSFSEELICLKTTQDAVSPLIDAAFKSKQTPQQILDLIHAKVEEKITPAFLAPVVIQNTVQAAFESKEVGSTLAEYAPLLKHVLGDREKLQLQLVVAIQECWDDHTQPKGVFKDACDRLYKLNVVSGKVFSQWKDDPQTKKTRGKQKALMQVLTWLQEVEAKLAPAHQDDDDDDDDYDDDDDDDNANYTVRRK